MLNDILHRFPLFILHLKVPSSMGVADFSKRSLTSMSAGDTENLNTHEDFLSLFLACQQCKSCLLEIMALCTTPGALRGSMSPITAKTDN